MIKPRRMRWAGHVARMEGRKRNTYKLLLAKSEERIRRHRWVDNIKTDLVEIR
jgi:hypothetical protein